MSLFGNKNLDYSIYNKKYLFINYIFKYNAATKRIIVNIYLCFYPLLTDKKLFECHNPRQLLLIMKLKVVNKKFLFENKVLYLNCCYCNWDG